MRHKLVTALTCLALFGALCNAQAQRQTENFDEGWRFHFGNAADPAKNFGSGTEYFNYLTKVASIHNEGPYCEKFVENDWKSVTLPHDFVVDLPFDEKASYSHDPACKDAERPTDANARDFTVKAFNGYARIFLQAGKKTVENTLSVTADGMKEKRIFISCEGK